MNTVFHILLIGWREQWIVVFPTDIFALIHPSLRRRMMRGAVRRRLIRRYGLMGLARLRMLLWWFSFIPFIGLWITVSITAGDIFFGVFWFVLGGTNLIDFITSWDDPPWRRAKRWASDKIQKLLQNMGERSRVPQPAYIPH